MIHNAWVQPERLSESSRGQGPRCGCSLRVPDPEGVAEQRPADLIDDAVLQLRLREAAKLGFRRCLLPQANCQPASGAIDMELCGVRTVAEALQVILQDDPAALQSPDDETFAKAPGGVQSWGKHNERPIGY